MSSKIIRAESSDIVAAVFGSCDSNLDIIEKKFGVAGEVTGYGRLSREMQEAKQRYLTKEEATPTVNCLVCKNCLPPFFRENGKMCKLKECKFEQA